jgi:hypothetical protein
MYPIRVFFIASDIQQNNKNASREIVRKMIVVLIVSIEDWITSRVANQIAAFDIACQCNYTKLYILCSICLTSNYIS